MAQKVLVKETLTREMIDAGAELVRQLDQAGVEVTSSSWWYEDELKVWKLLIASPLVRDEGPKKAYDEIQKVLREMPEDKPVLGLADLAVLEPDEARITSLRKMVKTKPTAVSGVSVTASGVSGGYIDDAFIYRST